MRRFLLAAGLCGLLAAPASAQEAGVHSEVDARKIGVEDVVQWSLSLDGAAAQVDEGIAVPPLKNLKVVGGPSVSTQISLVGGRMSQRKVLTWVLQPQAAGPAEIGAVKLKVGNQEVGAPAITLEVGAGSQRPAPQRRARPSSPFGPDPFEDIFEGQRPRPPQGKLFVEAVPSRTKVHVGEAFLLTYYVYYRGVQPTDMQSGGTPQYPGFWAENVESPNPPREEQVKVDGETLLRMSIYRKLLFPTKAGELTIPPLNVRVALARQSLFDSGVVVERSTKAIPIKVEALPPAAESPGAVGRFEVKATAEPRSLRLGEAATVRFRVEGIGNLKWVEKGPELAVPGAKVFPPQVKSNVQARVDGFAGSKTWEYVVVPETGGSLAVPALPFSYFDPATAKVVALQTEPMTIEVQGASVAGGLPAAGPALVPRDRSALALRDALDPERRLFPALGPSALAVVLLVIGLLHAGLAFSGRLAVGRSATSRASARAALKHLHQAAEPGLAKEDAAALIERALQEAFAGRNGDDGDPEREAVLARLVEEVQQVRYAPQLGDYSERLRDLARRAREAVQRWA